MPPEPVCSADAAPLGAHEGTPSSRTADNTLLRIGKDQRREHRLLTREDQCYYIWEYPGGLGRTGGPVNRLIFDLQLAPGAPRQQDKERAIAGCADALSRALSRARFQSATIVPIPPSKIRDSPSYDPRLRRVLNQVRPPLDIRELITQQKSVPSGTKGMTVAERISLLGINEEGAAPAPTTIILFDDLISGGSHFKAAQIFLQARYPDAEIIGVFLARRSLAEARRPAQASSPRTKKDKIPIPINGRSIDEVATDAVEALARRNSPPVIMVRGGQLVRVRRLGAAPPAQGRLVAEPLSDAALLGQLVRVVRFTSFCPLGQREVDPPLKVVRDITAMPSWPFAELAGIVDTPTLRPDGSILNRPGHDAATGLIYDPSESVASICVPDRPTYLEIRAACDLILNDCLGDFLFADMASRANALAMMLTPIVRPAVQCVPLAVVDAAVAGCGKGLLCSVAARIATGRDAPKGTLPEGAECRKTVTAVLCSGEPICVLDNVDTVIRSPHLAALLTTEDWRDRELGHSRELNLRNNVTWITTGNNVRLGGDMPRRCYWIRLAARTPHPELRTGFRHPDLRRWVSQNRARLLEALLTLVQGYVVGGQRPKSIPILGSFERWCEVIGTILHVAGVQGFLSDCVPVKGPDTAKTKAAVAAGGKGFKSSSSMS